MSHISIASPQEIVPIDRGRMREVVRAVLDGEGVADAEISLAFVDNPTIHRLNKRYLQHDEPTDVLSFPLSEPNAKRLAGELVIGAEVALAQAAERGHDVQAELALYVIHGLLHLCGYDDHDEDDAAAMRARAALFAATRSAGHFTARLTRINLSGEARPAPCGGGSWRRRGRLRAGASGARRRRTTGRRPRRRRPAAAARRQSPPKKM